MEHRPTLSDLIQAEQMSADIFLLFALDNAWTTYLNQTPSVPPHDEAMLRILADRISWLVDRLAHSATFVDRWARERAADMDETFRNQLAKLSDADRRNVEEVIAKHGGLSAAIANSCNTIRLEAPLNRRDNDEKMDRIASGQFTAGDMRSKLGCAGALIGVGLALYTLQPVMLTAFADVARWWCT